MTSPSAHSYSKTTVIFDTDCMLCSTWIRFLLRHEKDDTLQFASSRKAVGIQLAQQFGLSADALELTYLVIQNGNALQKSDASLALLATLRAPWRYLTVLRMLPRPLRDGIYDIVARNRLRWFGQKKDCFLPNPHERSKFLDALPGHGQPPHRAE